jgi:hypothetical protein
MAIMLEPQTILSRDGTERFRLEQCGAVARVTLERLDSGKWQYVDHIDVPMGEVLEACRQAEEAEREFKRLKKMARRYRHIHQGHLQDLADKLLTLGQRMAELTDQLKRDMHNAMDVLYSRSGRLRDGEHNHIR